MTDRSIPHLRDIFGFHNNWSNNNQQQQQQPQQQQQRHHHEVDLVEPMRGLRLDKESSSKKDKLVKSSAASAGNDSAISSIGSASEDEIPKIPISKKKKQRSRRENSKTLTEKDVKHLERHLSMKKTIRKKIMRDLQQAFVEDPNEFRVEDISHEQLKAEINVQSLSFASSNQKAGKKPAQESSFLGMLRGGSTNSAASPSGGKMVNDDGDSGHGSPTRDRSVERNGDYEDDDDENHRDIRKTSFWSRFTIKSRNKR